MDILCNNRREALPIVPGQKKVDEPDFRGSPTTKPWLTLSSRVRVVRG